MSTSEVEFEESFHMQPVCRRVGWKNPQPSNHPAPLQEPRWLAGAAWRRKSTEQGIPRGKFPTPQGYVKHSVPYPLLRSLTLHLSTERRRCGGVKTTNFKKQLEWR